MLLTKFSTNTVFRDNVIFIFCAWIIGFLFLYCAQSPHYAITDTHVECAHHILTTGNVTLADNQPFPVNDTIGYSILLALMWKVTGICSMHIVQIVQVLLMGLSMILIYQLGFIFWHSIHAARTLCISFLCFLPIHALNTHAVRDIWAYYALLALIFGVARAIQKKCSYIEFVIWMTVFALCQWIRPNAFVGILTLSAVIILWSLLQMISWQRACILLSIMHITNSIIFWMPFTQYNYRHYGKAIVGPIGQDLLEGLGEFENPWGFELDDQFVAQFIGAKYGLTYGTPEFDDAAYHEFVQACCGQPWLYYRNIIKRIPSLILPGLQWLFAPTVTYMHISSLRHKLLHAFQSPMHIADLLLRHVFIRLYILFGWIGLFLLMQRKQWWLVGIIIATVLASLGKLPSHIEYRYLVPFYWIWAFGVAETLCTVHALYKMKSRATMSPASVSS